MLDAPTIMTSSRGYECVKPAKHVPSLIEDVTAGLFHEPRSLPPKYFYDERGSMLFDRICLTPEYYPTRTEDALLAKYATGIIAASRPDYVLELGSGMSRKTQHILNACETRACIPTYLPFDVCAEVLLESKRELGRRYPWLTIRPLLGDYTAGLAHLPRLDGSKLVIFLGGTIGNFTEGGASALLREVRSILNPGDYLLLGADRVKDAMVLNAAYNDAAGITAQFNLNLLEVLNRELDADFDTDRFTHRAWYNEQAAQIEMYLVSTVDQRVTLAKLGHHLEFFAGSAILTEISRKFTQENLERMLNHAGFSVRQHYEPVAGSFSIMLAQLKR